MADRAEVHRPWPVQVLVASTIGSAISSLVTSDGNLAWQAVLFVIAIVFARFLWTGAPWAFTWSFMLASLCLGLTTLIVLGQFFLLEQTPQAGLIWALVTSLTMCALLMHPDTRAFAGLRSRKEPLSTA